MNERSDKPPVPVESARNQGKSAADSTVADITDKQNAHEQERVLIGFPQDSRSSNIVDYGRRARRLAESPQVADFPGEPEPEQLPTTRVPQWTPPGPDNAGELRYHTQAIPFASATPKIASPIVINSVPTALAAPPRALTRRELRELEASQHSPSIAERFPVSEKLPVSTVPPAKLPEATLPEAKLPEAKLPEAKRTAPRLSDVMAPTMALPTVVSPQPVAPQPVAPPRVAPSPVAAPMASSSVPPLVFPSASSAPKIPAPIRTTASSDFPATHRGVDLAPHVFTAPAGHWTEQPSGVGVVPGGASFIRTVGAANGAITTNALVIPSVPQAADITSPFGSTGEILITGSIDLPRSLGTIGALTARFDHSDIDALFAAEDNDHSSSDSAPVRAIRAVSTHTSSHGVISQTRPANNKLPMIMAVTAGILAVGVATLFTAGMIFGWF